MKEAVPVSDTSRRPAEPRPATPAWRRILLVVQFCTFSALSIALLACLFLASGRAAPAQAAPPASLPRAPAGGPGQTAAGLAFTPTPLVAQMLGQVRQDAVYHYEATLTGDLTATIGGLPYTIWTRHTDLGTPVQKATQYVYEHLQGLGLQASYQGWTDPSTAERSGRNVIGVQPGTTRPDEIVLITAHLDNKPATVYPVRSPGADDNASGSVAVLVAADVLSHYDFERTLRYVFFTGEEQRLLGSDAYAGSAAEVGENIVAVLNLDMIAWDSAGGPVLELHTRPEFPKYITPTYEADLKIAGVFTNVVDTYGLSGELAPTIVPDGEDGSDHASFWDRGYPAILAMEDQADFNPAYHTVDDTPQSLNMTYFTSFVKATVGTAAHLARPVARQGTLAGVVFDAANDAKIVAASVQAATGSGQTFGATTSAAGAFSLALSQGTYTVTAVAPGYLPFVAGGVQVVDQQTTTLSIGLEVTPTVKISGYVRDAETGAALPAVVRLVGAVAAPVAADPATGYYALSAAVPPGTHTLQADLAYYAPFSRTLVTGRNDLSQDLALHAVCLLVVDDDGGEDLQRPYTDALDRLGKTYTLAAAAPDQETLAHYRGVIWLTGNTQAGTLVAADRTALAAYLDGGGRLFLSGRAIGRDIGATAFYRDYLHAAYGGQTTASDFLDGRGFLDDLDVIIGGQGGTALTDVIAPAGGEAVYAYDDTNGYGGVAYDGLYRTVYFAFGYEAITHQGRRDAVMEAVLSYLGPCAAPAAPQAGFAAASPVGLGEAMAFTNTSRGMAGMAYTWDFGDGSEPSKATHPTHLYRQVGSKTVSLTAANRFGQDVHSETVTVGDCAQVHDTGFALSPASPVSAQAIVFSGRTGGRNVVTYTWSFGDGGSGTGSPISHTYPPSLHATSYPIVLTAVNLCGSTEVATGTVTVRPRVLRFPIVWGR